MRNFRQINEELELMSTLKLITQAYEEISVMRMQKIRDSVLKTRQFLDKLSEVFTDVKLNYENQAIIFSKKKDSDALLKLNKNGKEAALLISTNTKMNGEIVSKVFRTFVDYIEKHDVDIFILGKMGKQLLEQHGTKKQYEFFDLDENDITTDKLKDMILKLLNYKQVNVFYGKFESLMFQDPYINNLTGNEGADPEKKTAESTQEKKEKKDEFDRFIFEPSIEKVLQFFETQIFSSLVKQSVHESELARYASRIRAMEEAGQHIEKSKGNLYANRRKLKSIISNKKQLEVMTRVQML